MPRILLVEDEPAIARITAYMLELRGYRVSVAPGARAALQLASDEAFDLLLVDVRMPEMSGLELTRQLRSHPNPLEAPIVGVTATSAPAELRALLDAGMNDYVIKPYEASRLCETIERHLAGRGLHRV